MHKEIVQNNDKSRKSISCEAFKELLTCLKICDVVELAIFGSCQSSLNCSDVFLVSSSIKPSVCWQDKEKMSAKGLTKPT
jgi:hypothetical protein